ncbi:hypothetical protein CNMCM5793_003532 [Aspergillus hiratsukae]|uniref:Uncharacterized protein n=1 Tax=Aspergillus hiratsukae TaxID=1194566 RepID=A0A8H6PE06_9EURO|nr:hypothetical protein CNMCM5793_003532 [Aspergillus hiratsukae]KAF7172211.1 hypothetical protein CNMCM6106_006461 [Aspergillus hiratsukae]
MSTSYSNSNLSSPRYGYNFVVATTQISINAILLEFLSQITEPTVTACYVYDKKFSSTIPIDYNTFIQEANGTDPFNVPDGSDSQKDQDLINLQNVQFVGAFRATVGLPSGVYPADLPDLVTLGADTSQVLFNLLCSDFTVVGRYALSTVDQDAYSKLPPAVQNELKNLSGTAFSVQQLLFDLDNAGLSSTPSIPNIPAGSASSGQPLLGVSVVQQTPPTASLNLTDLNFAVSPYVDQNGQPYSNPTDAQKQMATLNYLCAINNNNLPPAVQFSWNWVDISDQSNFDGVVSVNCNDFAAYLAVPMAAYASQYCIQPTCHVDQNFMTTVSSGDNVMSMSYTATDSASNSVEHDSGSLEITATYTMSMSFSGTQVTITQQQVIYVDIERQATRGCDGNMVGTTITDTYDLYVDGDGNLGCSCTSQTVINPTFPPISNARNFFTGLGDISQTIQGAIQNFQGGQLSDMPLAPFQKFVFPGGNTFAFKNVQFSNNQDLVTAITYQDPSGSVAVVPKPSKLKTSPRNLYIKSIYDDEQARAKHQKKETYVSSHSEETRRAEIR